MFHKILRASIVSMVMLLFVSGAAFAATDTASHAININIPEIAMLDVTAASTPVEFILSAPANAGEEPTWNQETNNDKWLNYTSIVAGSSITREITAGINTAITGGVEV